MTYHPWVKKNNHAMISSIMPLSHLTILAVAGISFMLVVPRPAQAVIPPDLIFNLGAQVAQFFSIIVLFFSTIFGTLWHFFKNRLTGFRHRKLIFTVTIFVMIVCALALSYWYAVYQQNLVLENYAQ